MEIRLLKQPRKYLESVDKPTRKKLEKALDKLSRFEGDIVPLRGQDDIYRCKIEHYRILFRWHKGEIIIIVFQISTRGDTKY